MIESPLFWPLNENGPVPTGWVAIWPLSTFLRCTIAMPLNPPRLVSRFGVGCLTVITTVAGSGARDVGDGAEFVDVGQLLVDDAAVGVDDVVRGERAAVVKCDALSQMECPGELIGADVPRLRERGTHLEVFVGFDKSVEDVLEHLEREVGAGLLGVELVGLTGDRRDQIPGCLVAEVDPLAGGTAAECDDERGDHADSGQNLHPDLYPHCGAVETCRRANP